MQQPSRRVCVSVATLVVLFMINSFSAASGGSFQGFYEYRNVTAAANQVSLTLDLKLVNATGTDVHGATLRLESSSHPTGSYGSYPATSVAANHSVDISQTFTVPQSEFQHWEKGAQPRIAITYSDASGKTVQQQVQLIRRPIQKGN